MTIRLDGLGTDVVCWSKQEMLSHLKPGTLFSMKYDSENNQNYNSSNSFISLLENVERDHKRYGYKWAINLENNTKFNILLMFIRYNQALCFLYQDKLIKFGDGSLIQVFNNNCFIKLTILS